MAVRIKEASINVVEAAKIRIKNIFSNGVPVKFAFSGGKDSLCAANLIYDLIRAGEIDPRLLTVQFIDEEAIFPCVEKIVLDWRRKFMLAGARFDWYCIEVRHFNCFNMLASDESFICFDSRKEDVWVRRPPPFAIRSHPLLRARQDTYQEFCHRAFCHYLTIVGVRAYESYQRISYMAAMTMAKNDMTSDHRVHPIYDWKDNDVWLYLLNNKVEIPEIYLYMWQAGIYKNHLRVSQYFSIDSAANLIKMNEYYPDLLERVIRREPNAYLAALYWDTEMFRRSTAKRKALEKKDNQGPVEQIDYKAKLCEMFANPDKYFPTEHSKWVAGRYRNTFLQMGPYADSAGFKRLYEGLVAGDPKLRTLRAAKAQMRINYVKEAEAEFNMRLRTTQGSAGVL